MLETELFNPVKNYLEQQGFKVKGEIGSIDVLAIKKDYVIAVELKNQITLKLIYQAIERQKIADDVFIAIPKIAVKQHRRNMNQFKQLLKRLEIGLIIVDNNTFEVIIEPKEYNLELNKKRNVKKKQQIVSIFNNLKSNENIGGIKGIRMTVYREKVTVLAMILMNKPGISPKELREITGIDNVNSILQKNYYGWFERIERGSYQLSSMGIKMLNDKKEKTI
ncbi:MAG: hypothetical protein K0B10_14840 [Vicingaceae bacterium]|nr:hypothetical protein [Vicingaceae bacterium]